MALTEHEKLQLLRRIMLAGKDNNGPVSMPRTLMAQVLDLALGELLDEEWYLNHYSDVAEAVKKKQVPSARVHFTQIGLYEGRVPYDIGIDADAYLQKHRDVAASVRSGTYASGKDHFLASGFAEGRAFSLTPQSSPADTLSSGQ